MTVNCCVSKQWKTYTLLFTEKARPLIHTECLQMQADICIIINNYYQTPDLPEQCDGIS